LPPLDIHLNISPSLILETKGGPKEEISNIQRLCFNSCATLLWTSCDWPRPMHRPV